MPNPFARYNSRFLRVFLLAVLKTFKFLRIPGKLFYYFEELVSGFWFYLLLRPLARFRTLPNVILVGTSKSGTSSLAAYLARHPHFHSPYYKEIHYFNSAYHKGQLWYRSFFPTKLFRYMKTRFGKQPFFSGDFTPSYYFAPHVPQRILNLVGREVKLIMMVRNPIDRAISHYRTTRILWEKLLFEEALAAEEERIAGEMEKMRADPNYYSNEIHHKAYVLRGRYLQHIKMWHEVFPKENLLIVPFEELAFDPASVMKRVCEFIGMEPLNTNVFPCITVLPSGLHYCRRTNQSSLERKILAQANCELSAYLGEDFGWH